MTNMTALYIRLSSEDDKNHESDSVKNQRDLLNDFVGNHTEFSNSTIVEFADDGWSGTNFERPAIKNMLSMVRKGEIHCIIVKDFSRFGRNYIEVCDYLEQIFPFLGVRFISVTDNYDSNDSKGQTIGLETAFKTLIHDLYCKELSVKVRQGYQSKAKKGEYLNKIAPYGYKKSDTVKNRIVIDEPATYVVRRIFELATTGKKMIDIAIVLNNENVDTPLMYRKKNGTDGDRGWNVRGEVNYWNTGNITRILRDERYTGKLISGKRFQTKLGKAGCKDIPKKDWIVVENVHEAIISESLFQQVQSLLRPYKSASYKNQRKILFSGKVRCGHCGHSLVFCNTAGINQYYACISHRARDRNKCFSDKVTEETISKAVLAAIKVECKKYLNLYDENTSKAESGKKMATKNSDLLKSHTMRLEQTKNKKIMLFEEFTFNKIDKEAYMLKKDELTKVILRLEQEIKQIDMASADLVLADAYGHHDKQIGKLLETNEVTKEVLALVDSILVYDGTHIEIVFAFSDRLLQP